jgi:YidC/Oxa1 family membrane protein insertase
MDNRNLIIAIVLSLAVLLGWEYLVVAPRQHELAQQQAQSQPAQAGGNPASPAGSPASAAVTGPGAGPAAPAAPTEAATLSRDAALALSPRVPIASGTLSGSINLRGGRIDDLRLTEFHETVDKSSPAVVLLSPSRTPEGYFAEFGWLPPQGVAAPGPDTLWTAPAGAKLTPETPVALTFDNGAGLVFTRKIAVDQAYMFTVTDTVANTAGAAVTLTPYGRVVRLGEPKTAGSYILHEGPIGVFGAAGLNAPNYKDLKDKTELAMAKSDTGWLGFTDKYWAAAIVPGKPFESRFARFTDPGISYQADFHEDAVTVPPGGSAESSVRLFAGAKQVALVNSYRDQGIDRFDLLIDWGWFYFITKPMFFLIDWFYRLLGNFGLAILAVTVTVKLAFFPLANKSYRSMSAMRKVQPQMQELRERYKDDKVKQQQALMELYKKERINPLAGCWPMALQIPVFFSLYKVLYTTIEMRHAPFFGWIRDLSAPDPTSLFNLFGLLPFDPHTIPFIGGFAAIGIWPLIMGVTMFVQMRLNPTPADPAQQAIFTWMPLIFTFMLASFPAGLVIYWAWNNTLSVAQQYVIMRRAGVPVDLLGNITSAFKRPAQPAQPGGTKSAEALPVPANDAGVSKPQTRAKQKRGAAKAKPSSADA